MPKTSQMAQRQLSKVRFGMSTPREMSALSHFSFNSLKEIFPARKMVSITHTYLLIRLCPLSLSTIVKLFATHHKRKFLRQRYANAAPFGGIGLKKIELFAIKSRHKETSDGKRKKHRLTPAFCAIFFAFFIFLNIKEFERQGKSQKIQAIYFKIQGTYFKIYGLYFFGFPISKYASTRKNSKNAPNRRVFCSYNEIIMRFEVEDKRAYSLIYIMYAFGCLYVHGDTRICTKNQGEIECLLRLPGQMCLLR